MAGATDQPDLGIRGKGEILEHPAHHRRDIAIIQRALNERWEIPLDLLASLPARLKKILDDNPDLADRETVRVAQTIDRMVRTNQHAAALATGQKDEDAGYQPRELHKHEHLHVESPAEAPAPAQIEVVLVDDWYGSPDVLPAKKNGKAARNGKAKRNVKKKKGG